MIALSIIATVFLSILALFIIVGGIESDDLKVKAIIFCITPLVFSIIVIWILYGRI